MLLKKKKNIVLQNTEDGKNLPKHLLKNVLYLRHFFVIKIKISEKQIIYIYIYTVQVQKSIYITSIKN